MCLSPLGFWKYTLESYSDGESLISLITPIWGKQEAQRNKFLVDKMLDKPIFANNVIMESTKFG